MLPLAAVIVICVKLYTVTTHHVGHVHLQYVFRGVVAWPLAKVRGTLHVKLSGEVMLDKHSTMRDDDILFPFECCSSIYP